MLLKKIEETFEVFNPSFLQQENEMFKSRSSGRTYKVYRSEDEIEITRQAISISDYLQFSSFSKVVAVGKVEETIRGYKLHLTIQAKAGYRVLTRVLLIVLIPLGLVLMFASGFNLSVVLISLALIALTLLSNNLGLKMLRDNLSNDLYDLD